MVKSLVTGGAGFIGSHIVDKLIELGHEVVCIDNEFADNETFYWNKNSNNYKVDITNYDEILDLFIDVDYVFHCAAESRIGTAINNPTLATKINVLGTATVLQCAKENRVKRLIYSSTSSGYGFNMCPNTEEQPDDCLNPYSVSKIAGEKLCKMYTELYNFHTIIFRYFNVYGERAPKKGQYAPVIGIFLRQKKAEQELTIVGNGLQKRDFIYVGDVVDANILAALKKIDESNFGKVYNIGFGENISIKEIANLISSKQKFLEPRIGEVKENLADISRVKKVFGWQPKISVENWLKSNI
ncbi:MAG: hypothetical protein CMB29_05735 [Euryarchaeota archaeon]|nr:hypothetical protein [Euryarchaeota archaeon]|tara:strand:- start:22169 stop:23065 length:897 start_codon:yes stop_codon:yes gene_type:complete